MWFTIDLLPSLHQGYMPSLSQPPWGISAIFFLIWFWEIPKFIKFSTSYWTKKTSKFKSFNILRCFAPVFTEVLRTCFHWGASHLFLNLTCSALTARSLRDLAVRASRLTKHVFDLLPSLHQGYFIGLLTYHVSIDWAADPLFPLYLLFPHVCLFGWC